MALRDTETGKTIATNVSWNDLVAAVAENNRKYFEQIEKQEMDNTNCEGCLYWTGKCKLPKGLQCPEKRRKEMSNIEKIRQEIEKWIYNTDEWEVSPGKYNKSESEAFKSGWRCGLGYLREFIDSLPEETNEAASTMAPSCWGEEQGEVELVNDLEEAAKEYASKTLCDPDDGPSTGLAKESFIAGANYQRLKRLAEAAKSSSHLDAYIEGVRRSIEKQIGQLPPPPPGYYYTWELDTIRKEGQSFTAIARPLLKQINPEQ